MEITFSRGLQMEVSISLIAIYKFYDSKLNDKCVYAIIINHGGALCKII